MKRNIIVLSVAALVLIIAAAFFYFFNRDTSIREFRDAIVQAQSPILLEGLPHPLDDGKIATTERKTKAVQELHGDYFYQDRLVLKEEDATRLSKMICNQSTYKPVGSGRGAKMCGGFHTDYALQWQVGAEHYLALICFKCQEIKLFGPNIKAKHDLSPEATLELKKILRPYRKNRPPLEFEY